MEATTPPNPSPGRGLATKWLWVGAALCLITALGAGLVGCLSGRRIDSQELTRDPESPRRLVARFSGVTLSPGERVAIDTRTDYSGGGIFTWEFERRSQSGAHARDVEELEKSHARVIGSMGRYGPWVVEDAGPWDFEVTLRADESLEVDRSRATLVRGAVDTRWVSAVFGVMAVVLAVLALRRS